MFGFWMSLSLELLARAALAAIHPVLLADPREPDNIHYVFGVIPKGAPKSIQAKTVFARCSVLIPNFTDKMSTHCLIMADRRNSELHSGAAAFEGIENSKWLPATYEVIEVLLAHMGRDFEGLLGRDHAPVAVSMLKDRRDTIKKEVQQKMATAKKFFQGLSPEEQAERLRAAATVLDTWAKANRIRRTVACPACAKNAGMSGETVARSPVRIDELSGTIKREARILPNALRCPNCKLCLDGFQEINEVGLGEIYTVEEQEDPVEFFGIIPEEYVDVDDLVTRYLENLDSYNNE